MKSILSSDLMGGILFDIQKERERQEELLRKGKFPWSCDNLNVSDIKKLGVLAEEFGEAAKEACQIQEQYDRSYPGIAQAEIDNSVERAVKRRRGLLRAELIQVAAVCVAWCEALDVQLDDRAEFKADVTCLRIALSQEGECIYCTGTATHYSPVCEEHSIARSVPIDRAPQKREHECMCICKPYNGPGSMPGDKLYDPKCPLAKKHESDDLRGT